MALRTLSWCVAVLSGDKQGYKTMHCDQSVSVIVLRSYDFMFELFSLLKPSPILACHSFKRMGPEVTNTVEHYVHHTQH